MKKSGVYAIQHLDSGRAYVGSSVDMDDRWRQNKRALRAGTHHSRHLQRAWSKYGEDAFVFGYLEQCPSHLLIERENSWISCMSAASNRGGFNSAPVAGTTRGLAKSAETIAKIKAAKANVSEETRAKLRAAFASRVVSPEWRKAISDALRGVPRKPRTPETRARISASLTGRRADPDAIERMAQKLRGRKQDPEVVEKRAAKLRGQKRTEEAREKMRHAALRRSARQAEERIARMSVHDAVSHSRVN